MTPLVAAILAAAINTAQFAEWVIEGRVVAISDGGTITLLDGDKTQRRIRLVGIDAPERKQPFSDKSKVNISRLVFDKSVEAHCHKRDRYGREVCKVMRGATDVNLEQIRAGNGVVVREYAKEQSAEERARYAAEEEVAKAARSGLWRDAKPLTAAALVGAGDGLGVLEPAPTPRRAQPVITRPRLADKAS